MNTISCDNCGAVLISGARFCRQCGRPVPAMENVSVTEATTRLLNTPEAEAEHGQNYTTNDSTPLATRPPSKLHHTAHTDAPAHGRKVLSLSLAASLVLLVIFGALSALWYSARSVGTSTPPVITIPPVPAVPAVPPAFPPPGAVISEQEFFYPNAKVEQTIVVSGEPQMTRLRTNDAFGDVVRWYETRFKLDDKIITPGTNAVLRINSTTIIITTEGEGTSIMLTSESR